jgi:hypothetical protein
MYNIGFVYQNNKYWSSRDRGELPGVDAMVTRCIEFDQWVNKNVMMGLRKSRMIDEEEDRRVREFYGVRDPDRVIVNRNDNYFRAKVLLSISLSPVGSFSIRSQTLEDCEQLIRLVYPCLNKSLIHAAKCAAKAIRNASPPRQQFTIDQHSYVTNQCM